MKRQQLSSLAALWLLVMACGEMTRNSVGDSGAFGAGGAMVRHAGRVNGNGGIKSVDGSAGHYAASDAGVPIFEVEIPPEAERACEDYRQNLLSLFRRASSGVTEQRYT
ncbi:MAG TPA: hypothetical protein VJN18_06940 [Polyangiaceae bacterium]|nr:hypothetical protein [Polyangiaceae bacterium]